MGSIGIFQPSGSLLINNLVGNTTQATGVLTSPTYAIDYSGLQSSKFFNNVASDSTVIGVSGFTLSTSTLLKNLTVDNFDSHLLSTANIGSSGRIISSFSWDMEGQGRNGNWSIGADHPGSGIESYFVTDISLFVNGTGASGFLDLSMPYTHITSTSGIGLFIKYCTPTVQVGNIIIDRIGSDACDDYPNLAVWWDARKGDAVGSGLIYIAELQNEVFDAGSSPNLTMLRSEATTSASNYYWIRTVEGAEFDGQVSSCTESPTVTETGNYPKLTTNAKYSIFCDVPHTKFTNFGIENVGPYDDSFTGTEPVELYGMRVTSGFIDSVLVNGVRIHISGTTTDSVGKTYGIIATRDTTIQNSVVNDVRSITYAGNKTTSLYSYGIYASGEGVNCYNNLVGHVISAISGTITTNGLMFLHAYGIYTNNNNNVSGIINNVVHSVVADKSIYVIINPANYDAKCFKRNTVDYDFTYNVSSDRSAYGTGAISGINISNELQTYNRTGSFFADNFSTELKSSSQLRNTARVLNDRFSWDLKNQGRGDTWDFGPDEYGSGSLESLDLYINAYSSGVSSCDLFTKSWYLSSSGMDLSIANVHAVASGSTTLFIETSNAVTNSLPLFLDAGTRSSNLNLFIHERPIYSTSGNITLYTNGASGYNAFGQIPLAISGGSTNVSSYLNLHLFSNQGATLQGAMNLFTFTPRGIISSGVDLTLFGTTGLSYDVISLFLEGPELQASGNLNLSLLGAPVATVTATMPLYTVSHIQGTVPLFVSGITFSRSNLNLFVHAGGSLTTTSNSVPFFTYAVSPGTSGLLKSVELFASGEQKVSSSLNLTILSPASGHLLSTLNLYVDNSYPTLIGNVDLFVSNYINQSGITLFTTGQPFGGEAITAVNDGWKIGYSSMNLFINRPGDAAMTPMFIEGKGLVTTSGEVPLYLRGITGVLSSGIALYTKSAATSGLTLYVNGW